MVFMKCNYFLTGPCGSDDDTFFSCKNNRCIDNEFTCQNLNPCGDNSDCPSKEETSLWEDIFNKIKIVLVVIIIMLVVVGFIKFCKKVKGRVGDICSDLADCVVNACRRIKRSVTSAGEVIMQNYVNGENHTCTSHMASNDHRLTYNQKVESVIFYATYPNQTNQLDIRAR